MPITPEQLESIKAANHAASIAWESTLFITGDVVISHGHRAQRTAAGLWTCTQTGTEYATLSRYFRHKLNRRSFDVKWGTYLMVGTLPIQMCRVPPPAERVNYFPWTAGRPCCPWYLAPVSLTSSAPQNEVIPTPPQNEIIPRGTQASPSPPPNSPPVQENKNRPQTLEERVAFMEERLMAVAAVAAHAALMKDELKTLQNKMDELMNRRA